MSMSRDAIVCWSVLALVGLSGMPRSALSAAILTRPTLSPDAKPDSEEALRFCVESSSSDEKASACIGSTIDYCVEHIDEGGRTDLNYSKCQSRELTFWDRMLNDRYQTEMAKLSSEQSKRGKLKAAQQSWLKLRSNFCGIIADIQGSTYYVSNMYTNCKLSMTARQVINLGDLSEILRR